jgi:hypothetical protein
MNAEEIINSVDEVLEQCEDIGHGRLGEEITKAMKNLIKLKSLTKQVEDIKRKSKLEELNDLKTYAGFMSDMSSKTYLYSRILERIKTLNNDK